MQSLKPQKSFAYAWASLKNLQIQFPENVQKKICAKKSKKFFSIVVD